MKSPHAATPLRLGMLVAAHLLCGCQGEGTTQRTVFEAASRVVDLTGALVSPLTTDAEAHVLAFVRIDCPISNRYAPELVRLARRFEARGVRFTLVYTDRDETAAKVAAHQREFSLDLPAVLDLDHALVRRAGATRTPEVAVFDRAGVLAYRGRIDDTWVTFGRARPAPTRRDLALALEATLTGEKPSPDRTEAIGCHIPKLERAL